VGVPPLVGVAVKVTEVPAQIVPEGDTAILTLARSNGLTTIVRVFDVAGLPVAHEAFEVKTHIITSPFAGI
jgi:hypothetical protein